MDNLKEYITDYALKAKKASRILANLSSEIKNKALLTMAKRLEESKELIINENNKDLETGQKNNLSSALLDRLTLSEPRIKSMAAGLREISALPDPVGEIIGMWKMSPIWQICFIGVRCSISL